MAGTIITDNFYKFQIHSDERGNLVAVEAYNDVPFEIKRVFYISDVPVGKSRAEHSHENCHQMIIALRGKFVVELNDIRYKLDEPNIGLYVRPGDFISLKEFSLGSICLVLASEPYDPNELIYDKKQKSLFHESFSFSGS